MSPSSKISRTLLTLTILIMSLAAIPGGAAEGNFWVNDRAHNPRRGGWVDASAYVTENAFIGPAARVLDNASVRGIARVYGTAVISGEAIVDGHVEDSPWSDSVVSVYGNARVSGSAVVKEGARVYGNANVSENANVENGAAVYEEAMIRGNAIIREKAKVCGHAIVSGTAVIGGNAVIRGYARISSGIITNGIIEPPEPEAETPAREPTGQGPARSAVETAPSPAEADQTAAQKESELKDFYARVNKQFSDLPVSFQRWNYGDKTFRELELAWDTKNYDVIKKQPEFTYRLLVQRFKQVRGKESWEDPWEWQDQADGVSGAFKLEDIAAMTSGEDKGIPYLKITLYKQLRLPVPDWGPAGAPGVKYENSREISFVTDPANRRNLNALTTFLKAAVNEYRRLTGAKAGSRALE